MRLIDKYRQVCYNKFKAYCTKTVGGSNLPPEMEVSCMNVATVITLLNLIINIIRLALYISKNKKK